MGQSLAGGGSCELGIVCNLCALAKAVQTAWATIWLMLADVEVRTLDGTLVSQ